MVRELIAALVSAGFLLGAVGLWAGLKRLDVQIDGPSFIAVLVVPILLYALASGHLKEFSGPGGLSASFEVAVAAPIGGLPILESLQEFELVGKGQLDLPPGEAVALSRQQPNALLLRVGREGYVDKGIRNYILSLQALGTATYVLFVDDVSEAFVGIATGDQILAILRPLQPGEQDDGMAAAFMSELQSPHDELFSDYPIFRSAHVEQDDDVRKALSIFNDSGAPALAVLDANLNVVGIVERARLVTTLLGKLASPAD